jgi:hypothetical protein
MARRNAFITLKDHKENLDSNPKCCLINPLKSELGMVSKIILDNNKIRSTLNELNLNQWKNTESVISWFQTINDKPNHTFLSFDIIEFYPSISEHLLDEVISCYLSHHFHCCCFKNTNGLYKFAFKTKLTLDITRKHLKDILKKVKFVLVLCLHYNLKNIAFTLVFRVLIYMSSLCVFLSL